MSKCSTRPNLSIGHDDILKSLLVDKVGIIEVWWCCRPWSLPLSGDENHVLDSYVVNVDNVFQFLKAHFFLPAEIWWRPNKKVIGDRNDLKNTLEFLFIE